MAITGTLKSVDQFLNIKLDNIHVVDEERYPHMVTYCISLFLILIILYSLVSRTVLSEDPSFDMSNFLLKQLIQLSYKTQLEEKQLSHPLLNKPM